MPGKKAVKKVKKVKTAKKEAERILIGRVTHFYPKISVAVISLNSDLKVGDKVSIEKGDDKVKQTVDSMQMEHEQIESAETGQEIAIKVDSEVKEGAEIYKA